MHKLSLTLQKTEISNNEGFGGGGWAEANKKYWYRLIFFFPDALWEEGVPKIFSPSER